MSDSRYDMRYVLALVATFVVAFAAGTAASSADASVSAHWDRTWGYSSDVDYKIDSSRAYPFGAGSSDPVGSDFYFRTKDAAAAWTNASTGAIEPDFVISSQISMSPSLGVSSVPEGSVYVMDYWNSSTTWNWPSNTSLNQNLGETISTIYSNGQTRSALIRINDDNDIDWHSDTGTSVGTYEFNLQGVVTHEFGHSLGAGHFTASAYCSGAGSGYQTMCNDRIVFRGNWYSRTLESHEISDFKAAY